MDNFEPTAELDVLDARVTSNPLYEHAKPSVIVDFQKRYESNDNVWGTKLYVSLKQRVTALARGTTCGGLCMFLFFLERSSRLLAPPPC